MRFSIIVPVYNVAPYLRECLDSIRGQTYTDWECICVDDGSMDGSGQLLDEFAACDGRFVVRHKENGGVSAARNLALGLVTGDVVCFVDADDAVCPQWLEAANAWIAKTDADILRIEYAPFTDALPAVPVSHGKMVNEVRGAKEVLQWGVGKLLKNGHLWRGLYRRRIVEGLTFPVGVRMMEDCAFQMWMLVRAAHVVEIDFVGYYYRQREGSAVHTLPKNVVADKLLYLAELRRWYVANVPYFEKQEELRDVQRELWKAVFESVKDAVVQYRVMRGRFGEYAKIAHLLREMQGDGAFGMGGVPHSWRLAMSLYVRYDCIVAVLVRWKISAGCSKFRSVLFEKLHR